MTHTLVWPTLVVLTLGLVAPALEGSQVSSAPATPEVPATVVRHYRETILVETDGTERREIVSRIKVNTEAGRQEAGTIEIPYERDLATLTIHYARVRKAGGEVIETPVEGAINVPAESTREAAMYSDAYERHLNLRNLAVGDEIELGYRVDRRPFFAGHVSFESEWLVGEVVEDGEVTPSAPASMPLVVKTHGTQPAVSTRDGRRLHVWKFDRPRPLTSDEIMALVDERQKRRPAVQVTSFRSWEELGESVRRLWRDRATVTPAIREKAASLTAKLTTTDERVRAIYAFVSNDIRYVAISFGIGRIQPHAAAEVLSNGFGDCKDKHVLLEALLRAAGIESSPALIGPGQPLDAEVPSIAQFTHVITRVDAGPTPVWLDATLELAAPGYLIFPERNRQVLTVPSSGASTLMRTPVDPPRPNLTSARFTGAIDASGKLEGTVEETYSGDLEYFIRLGLRATTESTRAQLFDGTGSFSAIPGGAASNLKLSGLEDLSIPLRATYTFIVKNYTGWSRGEIDPPLSPVIMAAVPTGEATARPLALGFTMRGDVSARVELPVGYTASIAGEPTVETSMANEFFAFRQRTAIEGGTLVAERQTEILRDEVPVDRLAAFSELRKVATAAPAKITVRDSWPWTSTSDPRFGTPAGKNPVATQLVTQALRSSNTVAIGLLRKAVEIEPDHPMAWSYLGERVTYSGGELEEGERLMRRQIEVASSADAYKRIATTFLRHVRYPIAERALREGAERHPDDRDLPAMLGEVLLSQGKNAEAAAVLQAEVEKRPRSSRLQSTLGRAYVRTGQIDKGVAAIHQSVVLEAGPNIWSLAARELLTADRDLDRALDYADRAVKRTFTENATAEFARLPAGSANASRRLAFYMETLGRVLLRQNVRDRAELYCRAAFELEDRNGAAGCLAELATDRGEQKSAEMLRMHARLPYGFGSSYLPPGEFDFGPRIDKPRSPAEAELRVSAFRERTAARTFTVPRPDNASGTAQFDLLTGPDGRVREARTVSATPAFEAIVGDLLNMKIGPQLPENAEARLVRRVSVSCDQPGPSCSMRLTE